MEMRKPSMTDLRSPSSILRPGVKMMLKIKLFGLVGAIVLVAMATACNPETATTSPESDTTTESPSPAPDPDTGAESAEGRAAYSEGASQSCKTHFEK